VATPEHSSTAVDGILQAYSPTLGEAWKECLGVGVDNIRHDVFLSPCLQEQGEQFLHEQILYQAQPHLQEIYPSDAGTRSKAYNDFKRTLGKVLEEALSRAKEADNIQIDLLARVAICKWLRAALARQFDELPVACRERIKKRGWDPFDEIFRSKIGGYRSSRRSIVRAVAEMLYQLFEDFEEKQLRPARLALFGSELADFYQELRNRLLFLENPNDAVVHLEHYVMLGHFGKDVDHVDRVYELLAQLLRGQGLTRLESGEAEECEVKLEHRVDRLQEVNRLLRQAPSASAPELSELEREREKLSREVEELEQKVAFRRQSYGARVSEILGNPANAEQLFGPVGTSGERVERTARQEAFLRELHRELERAGMLRYILASYHLRPLYKEFCPPLNPQQLKRALVGGEGWEELETLLAQFPARNFPVEKLEELARRIRRFGRSDAYGLLARFGHDSMRLRRDLLHLENVNRLMERIHLVGDDKTRQVSRMNGTLYEFVLPRERETTKEVLSHVVVKADVRDSTRIIDELLDRRLNPATHFSNHFYEPVRKLLDHYDAKKIFIEGDAMILGLDETEANRASQRPVAKACLLAKEIIHVCQAYNLRARANDLPILELGLGIAFQNSRPHKWTDWEMREVMISPALNEADWMSSCTRVARKLLADNNSPYHVYLLQAMVSEKSVEEQEELLFRYNVMGVELNQEGFEKLGQEISLRPEKATDKALGRRESITLYHGTVPLGNGFEKLILREARIVRLGLPNYEIEGWLPHHYYEVLTDPKLYELYEKFPAP
jgi:hypothetical protein